MRNHHFITITLFLICLPLTIFSQESRGTILGRVTDVSGAAVAAATVEVFNVDTGVTLRTTTNESGNYQLPFLVIGNYTVRVESRGFKQTERQNIRVSTNTQVTLDFMLAVGELTEKITITDSAPLLNTANADLGQVFDPSYIGVTPITTTRNVLNTVYLAPGVTGGGGSVTGNNAGAFSVSGGGSSRGRIEYLLDGIPNTLSQASGGPAYIPSVDAVEEIKVQTTMFDASYGHSNGGAINITTRGGSNDLRGTAYLFKRWSALNANTWENNRLKIPKTPGGYAQYGYVVSGPVLLPWLYNGRNRTFFSTTLERDKDPRTLTREARVPTDLERQGDFSQTLNRQGGALTLYDPLSTVVTGGKAARTAFVGNRIPANRLSPTGQALLNLLPKPNLNAPAQLNLINWRASGIYRVIQTQESFRIDHVVSEKQRLFVRFGHLNRDQRSDVLIPGQTSYPVQGGADLGLLIRRFYNFGVDDTYTFSPTLIGSVRYGFARRSSLSAGAGVGFDTSALKLPEALLKNQTVQGLPGITLGENLPGLGSGRSTDASDMHSLMAAFTKLKGRHSLKFGVDYRSYRWNVNSPGGSSSGAFTFNAGFTQADPFTPTSANTTGSTMASLLLGLPISGGLGFVSAQSLQSHYVAAYLQEDWKVNARLTLNFGLRYELETPLTERYNRMSYAFDKDAKLPVNAPGLDLRGGILFAGVNGNPRRGPADTNNFGPRFGFAYSLTPKTVLRGGYGLFYSSQAFNDLFFGDVGVFNATTPFVGSTDNGATPFATLANPFPTGLRQPLGSSVGLLAQAGDAVNIFNLQRVSPYNQQWQLSVQRQLPGELLLEAAYIGTLGLKQLESFNLNEKPDRFLAQGAAENNRVPNPFLGVFPATSVLGQGATITQNRLWVQYPQFTSITLRGANTGRSIYHGLQVKADKRLTRGFNALFTYTWSKLLDNETTSLVNPRRYRTVSSIDQPHLVTLAASYQFPWRWAGDSWSGLLNQTLGGWSLNGYFNYSTGAPLGVTHANGRPVRLRNPARDDAVGDRLGDRIDPTTRVPLNPYFDITAFAPLANQYTIAPDPPRLPELRAPGFTGLNLSVFKTFALYERFKLQFRAESTGVLNSPQFGAPGTNLSDPTTFGVIRTASGSREFQFALRLMF